MKTNNCFSSWWGFLPHVALIVGLYILHSAWWALALEGVILSAVLSIAFRRGWRPRAGSLALRHVFLLVAHLLAGPTLFIVWRDQNAEALRALLASLQITREVFWLAILLHCTMVPLLEELFWRGALLRKGRGLVKPDVLFALYHILILLLFMPAFLWPVSLAVLAGAAWLWRQEVIRSTGVLPAFLFHGAADLSLLLTVWIMVY